jgi:aminoglycoside phosphotransferase (APT) family kinase protein
VPIDLRLLQWAADVMGDQPYEVRGLRDGGSPWLLRFEQRSLVLRIGTSGDAESTRIEQLALELATAHGIPGPHVVAGDAQHDPPLLLIDAIDGTSAIPPTLPPRRLALLGALSAHVHAIPVPPELGLPHRDRPIALVDFAALRAQQPAQPLLARAEQVMADIRPGGPDGFVHGDLWQGNTMWRGEALVGVIDWDCAGVGPAGVDLGSLRCDAAVCFGVPAAADVLAGWEGAAGRPADDVAYWDVVAALSTPPDMGWFAQAIGSQGRPDLTQDILLQRRDEFLAAALDALGAA